jgi:DNA-binding response OmpR family regulator
VIAIISSSTSELTALTGLCASHGWVALACESLQAATRLMRRSRPQVIVVRHTIADGFSDHLLMDLAASQRLPATRVIVLVGARVSTSTEARQITLGADCVLRDPVRLELLLAYLAKYQRDPRPAPVRPVSVGLIHFAGGTLRLAERKLQRGSRSTLLTPREVELVDHLVAATGEVVSYETLYGEILRRPFTGDTSNMRVLLRKLANSAAAIGLPVRKWVEVIPKSGYRYRSD